jgi:putative sterol carrier protein
LVEDGVVQRRRLDPPARSWVYELTAWGRQLGPVLTALGRWGSRATPIPPGDLSTSALLVALQTTHESRRANAAPLAIELRLGDYRYRVRMENGAIDIASGAATKPDATLETDAPILRRIVFGDLSLADALEKGGLRIDGSARAAARFVESFRRPVPIAASEIAAPPVARQPRRVRS